MKQTQKNPPAEKKTNNPPVLAKLLSRKLNKAEIEQVAGAGSGKKCWDTDNGGIFTQLDCSK